MRRPDLSAVRSDLAKWSEPLIADWVAESYAAWFGDDRQRLREMAQQHCRVWCNLLRQEDNRAYTSRRELIRLGKHAGLDAQMLDQIDETVLDELADVAVARFNRSPSAIRDYFKLLMRAATSLAEVRLTADSVR